MHALECTQWKIMRKGNRALRAPRTNHLPSVLLSCLICTHLHPASPSKYPPPRACTAKFQFHPHPAHIRKGFTGMRTCSQGHLQVTRSNNAEAQSMSAEKGLWLLAKRGKRQPEAIFHPGSPVDYDLGLSWHPGVHSLPFLLVHGGDFRFILRWF